jgi:hypothetical protein
MYAMGGDNLVAIPPERLLSNLAKTQPKMLHYSCPAFLDNFKNTFIIRAPFDISLEVNPNERAIYTDKNAEFSDKYITNRLNNSPSTGDMVFSINNFVLMVTDDDVEAETIPCFYHQSDFVDKTMLVSGRFNIRNWIRPLEAACIIKNSSPNNQPVTINIKRGDPLFYVRLHPKDGSSVKLEQETNFDEIEKYTKYTWVTTTVKQTNPNMKLFDMYKMFEKFRPRKFFNKCPFNWKK